MSLKARGEKRRRKGQISVKGAPFAFYVNAS